MQDNTSSPTTGSLRVAREGPVGFIILDNPQRYNALTSAMWQAIPEAAEALDRDPTVRVIIVRGAGEKAFSAGADISEFGTARSGAEASNYDALNEAAFQALRGISKPTIAMIHGVCLGGGLAIAACCDLRFSDETGLFGIPAARLGIGFDPRWVATLLELAAASRVRELIFTGRRFNAQQAAAMGLVDRVVGKADLDSEVRTLADEITANAPLTIRAAKAAINEISRRRESADFAALKAMSDLCMQSADYAEGRQAFLEKRRPKFEGR